MKGFQRPVLLENDRDLAAVRSLPGYQAVLQKIKADLRSERRAARRTQREHDPNAPPADPEPATYILTTVDVTYTFQPPIPLWNFAKLGISATLPPTTIHRRAVMRMLQ